MSREAWIEKTRDEIAGAVLDLLCRRDAEGGELSLMVRRLYGRINEALGRAYDQLQRVPNGTARK